MNATEDEKKTTHNALQCNLCEYRTPYTYEGNYYYVSDKWCEYYESTSEIPKSCKHYKLYLPRQTNQPPDGREGGVTMLCPNDNTEMIDNGLYYECPKCGLKAGTVEMTGKVQDILMAIISLFNPKED